MCCGMEPGGAASPGRRQQEAGGKAGRQAFDAHACENKAPARSRARRPCAPRHPQRREARPRRGGGGGGARVCRCRGRRCPRRPSGQARQRRGPCRRRRPGQGRRRRRRRGRAARPHARSRRARTRRGPRAARRPAGRRRSAHRRGPGWVGGWVGWRRYWAKQGVEGSRLESGRRASAREGPCRLLASCPVIASAAAPAWMREPRCARLDARVPSRSTHVKVVSAVAGGHGVLRGRGEECENQCAVGSARSASAQPWGIPLKRRVGFLSSSAGRPGPP